MIINTQLGGKKPTGTTQITSNGTHNVAGYEFADVQVPTTAPALYREFEIDSNGMLQPNTTTQNIMNFTGVKDANEFAMAYAYYNNTAISGTVNLSDLTEVTKQMSFYHAFDGCIGITDVNLSSLKSVSGSSCFNYTFQNCVGITNIDLSSLEIIISNYGCQYMFSGCTGITGNIDLSSLIIAKAIYACGYMFSGCTGIINADVSKVVSTGNATNVFEGMFKGCTGLTSLNLNNLTYMNDSGLKEICNGCTALSSVDISHLTRIAQYSIFSNAFKNCTSLTSLSFDGLAYSGVSYDNAFAGMLTGCSNVTVHFPADWQTTMSSWYSVTNGFGGTNTTVLWDLPSVTTLDLNYAKKAIESDIQIFNSFGVYLPNITKFDIKDIETIQCGQFYQMFQNRTALTSIDLSGLKSITGTGTSSNSAFGNAFAGCTGLTGAIDLSSLETITQNYACYYMFRNCTGITSVNLSNLTTVNGTSVCQHMFNGCTGLTVLNFPKLTTVSAASVFSNMLANTSGVTVHFPSNFGTTVTASTLGGTGTTVLYDLPAA